MSYPLSDSQQRFWKGHQLQPDVPLYNMAWRFDLRFDLSADLFQQAFTETMQENAVLRTVFQGPHDSPVQFAAEPNMQLLECFDLSTRPDAKGLLDQQLDELTRSPFDLSHSTLRSQLLKLSEHHWVWAVCQHHIVCDAQSGALLFTQMSRRYAALESGEATKLDPSPSFFDSAPMKAQTAGTEPTSPAQSATPPYGSVPKRSSFSKRLSIAAEPFLAEQMEDAITRPAFRLFTPDLSRLALYLTAYIAYLHRVTGDDRITIGLPSHNRLSDVDKATLGPFVEVLPVEIELGTDDTFLDLHTKVKSELGVFLRRAKPGAAAAENTSAISAVLNYIQAEFGEFAGHPADVQWHHSGAHDAAHAMRLHVMDFTGSGTPDLQLDVQSEVLDVVSPDALQSHFLAILDAALKTPETTIAALDLATDDSDRAILFGPAECLQPQTVLQAFAAQVENSPGSVALSQAEARMTYGELDLRSDQIAAYIARQGITPGSSIAIHMPRSFEFVFALLGILKAGCSFVPIAANTPFVRADEIISRSGARAVVLASSDTRSFACQSLDVANTAKESDPIVHAPDRTDLAYILFTSGSTGTPKGVEVSHESLSRYTQWAAGTFSGPEPAHYAFFSSVSFDLTLTSLFVPLISGGSIRIYPERTDPDLAVLDVFAEDAVDLVKLTPSHLALVCKQGRAVQRIRTLVLGGENLTSQLCRMAQQVLSPDLSLINEYGPTEAVVGAMHHKFDARADTATSVQIGRPASGMSISIRDKGMNICPLGVTGEIVISGRLAKGYLASPAETAAKFCDDPVELQGRVYRSGDLGRITLDGRCEYLGRLDQQIKIGGVRFEVAEIDHVLRQLPSVSAVHVATGSVRKSDGTEQRCRDCGVTSAVPGIAFPERDLCGICAEFDRYKDRAAVYFRDEPELRAEITKATQSSTGQYDTVMMLSGGKDSTYAAYRLAGYTSRVLAVTLDNGYISDQSKDNIQRVVDDLGWSHRYLSTDKMNQIFVDSLKMHSNVCQGCFKALYTLAFRTALAEGAPLVVTGLSRGQFFETRLTPDLFRNAAPTCAQLDDMVTKARKAYHAEDDALSRLLETDDLKDGQFLDQVAVLDIYRYIDVPVSEIYAFLEHHTAWQRPSDTGRSTNCLINDAGIHVHKNRKGYHNYALPYAWDVRMGHKTRAQALEELDDQIDADRVQSILNEIGFDEPIEPPTKLTVYVAGQGVGEQEVWQTLQAHFSRSVLPEHVVVLDEMPLTNNGKVDVARLPTGRRGRTGQPIQFVAPETDMELRLSGIVAEVLKTSRISVTADFFDLGLDSLAAIEIAIKANECRVPLPATALFEYRTLRSLAGYAETLPEENSVGDADDALIELDEDDLSSIAKALG